jgi:hypothetical protein
VSKRKVLLVFVYRVHAIERMFQRDVSEEDVDKWSDNFKTRRKQK